MDARQVAVPAGRTTRSGKPSVFSHSSVARLDHLLDYVRSIVRALEPAGLKLTTRAAAKGACICARCQGGAYDVASASEKKGNRLPLSTAAVPRVGSCTLQTIGRSVR
jgi:hypothetical protein